MPQNRSPAPAPAGSQTITLGQSSAGGGSPPPSSGGSWGAGQSLGAILNASRASPAMGGGRAAFEGQPLPRGSIRDLPVLTEELPAESEALPPAAGGGASGDVHARLATAQAEVDRRRDAVAEIVRWHEDSLRQIDEDRQRIQAELARETEMLHAEGQVTASLDERRHQLEDELDTLDRDKEAMESQIRVQQEELAAMERELGLAEQQLEAQEQRIEQLHRALEQQELTQRDFERQLEDMRRQEREILDQLEASQAAIARMEEVLGRLERDEEITREELEAATHATAQSRNDLDQAQTDYSQREHEYEAATQRTEAEEMNAQFRQQELERVQRRCQELEQLAAQQQADVERLQAAADQEKREMERLQEEMDREQQEVQRLEAAAQEDERRGDDHCAAYYRNQKQQHQERLNAARRQLGTNNARNAARLQDAQRRLAQHEQLLQSEQAAREATNRSKQECDQNLERLRGETNQAHSSLIRAEGQRTGARIENTVALAAEAALQSDVRRLTDHIAWQRSQTHQFENRRDRIVQQKQAMEQDIQRCSDDITRRSQEIAALETEATANLAEVVAKRQAIEGKRSELSALEGDLASVQRDLMRVESQLQENGANLDENRQCTQMHRQHQATMNERTVDLDGRLRHHEDQYARQRALRQNAERTAQSELQRAHDAIQTASLSHVRDQQQRNYANGK